MVERVFGYKYIPYKQVENGIFFGETWSYNGDTYVLLLMKMLD